MNLEHSRDNQALYQTSLPPSKKPKFESLQETPSSFPPVFDGTPTAALTEPSASAPDPSHQHHRRLPSPSSGSPCTSTPPPEERRADSPPSTSTSPAESPAASSSPSRLPKYLLAEYNAESEDPDFELETEGDLDSSSSDSGPSRSSRTSSRPSSPQSSIAAECEKLIQDQQIFGISSQEDIRSLPRSEDVMRQNRRDLRDRDGLPESSSESEAVAVPVSDDAEDDFSASPISRHRDLYPQLRQRDEGPVNHRKSRDSAVRPRKEISTLPDPLPNELQWKIPNFLELRKAYPVGQKILSDPKTYHGFRWRIMLYPNGTRTTKQSGNGKYSFGVFVEAVPSEDWPDDWMFYNVSFHIYCINWRSWDQSNYQTDHHTFQRLEVDRGWHDFIKETTDIRDFFGPNGDLILRAAAFPKPMDFIKRHGSLRGSGLIWNGLKNHGATCYMNSLLQSLYHVGEFRRAVIAMTTDTVPPSPNAEGGLELTPAHFDDKSDEEIRRFLQDDEGEKKKYTVAGALQNLFYRLSLPSSEPVPCKELIRSFGWDSADAFIQHDAQELNRLLCDKLEEQMKGCSTDRTVARLFEGEYEMFIDCLDVEYKSARKETFHDIQLDVKGVKSLEESLRHYVQAETLEGDNLYESETFGKQRAKKGVRFLKFPPVIQFHLKRFMFDLKRMDMVKINDRFEFPETLSLDPDVSGAGEYTLHSVVVHQGDVNSGHYYAFIRPGGGSQWVKFDDEKVTPVTDTAVIEENFGGPEPSSHDYLSDAPLRCNDRLHSAYILFYVKTDMAATLLKEPIPDEVNPEFVARAKSEQLTAQLRARLRDDLTLNVRIQFVTEEDLLSADYVDLLPPLRHVGHCRKEKRSMKVDDLYGVTKALIEQGKIRGNLNRDGFALWMLEALGPSCSRSLRCVPITYQSSHIHLLSDFLSTMQDVRQRLQPSITVLVHPLAGVSMSQRNLDDRRSEFDAVLGQLRLVRLKFFDALPESPIDQGLYFAGFQEVPANATVPSAVLEKKVSESILRRHAHGTYPSARKYPPGTYGGESTDEEETPTMAAEESPIITERLKEAGEEVVKRLRESMTFIEQGETSPLVWRQFQESNGRFSTFNQSDHPEVIVMSFPVSKDREEEYDMSMKIGSDHVEEDPMRKRSQMPHCMQTRSMFVEKTLADVGKIKESEIEDWNRKVMENMEPWVPFFRFSMGHPTRVPEGAKYAPKMPTFPSCRPSHWRNSRAMRRRITVRLYDPLQILGHHENVSGQLLGSDGKALDLHSTRKMIPTVQQQPQPGELPYDAETGPRVDSDDAESEMAPSRWGEETPAAAVGNPKAIATRTLRISVDLRWPYGLAFRLIAWEFGVDPEYLWLQRGPPLQSPNTQMEDIHHLHREPRPPGQNGGQSSVVRLNDLFDLLEKRGPSNSLCFSLLPRAASEILSRPLPSSPIESQSLILRLFNSKVEAVGAIFLTCHMKDTTCGALVQLARNLVPRDLVLRRGFDLSDELRLVEAMPQNLKPLEDDQDCRASYHLHRVNCFAQYLRLEPRPSSLSRRMPRGSPKEEMTEGKVLLQVIHANQDMHHFGHPFEIYVDPHEQLTTIKSRIMERLGLSWAETNSWRFHQYNFQIQTFLRDDDRINFTKSPLCLLAQHPDPFAVPSRFSRRHQQLHIR